MIPNTTQNSDVATLEKQLPTLKEIRCKACSKKLAEQQATGRIEIKCPRCGSMNKFTI